MQVYRMSLDEIVVCIYDTSSRFVCFYERSRRDLCGSRGIFAGVGLDKLLVLCYTGKGHKSQKGL